MAATEKDQKNIQRAVSTLVNALPVPEHKISSIEIRCGGVVRVLTRDRAALQVAHVSPFKTEPAEEKPSE